jgi:hypothetical protein
LRRSFGVVNDEAASANHTQSAGSIESPPAIAVEPEHTDEFQGSRSGQPAQESSSTPPSGRTRHRRGKSFDSSVMQLEPRAKPKLQEGIGSILDLLSPTTKAHAASSTTDTLDEVEKPRSRTNSAIQRFGSLIRYSGKGSASNAEPTTQTQTTAPNRSLEE